MGCVLSLKEKKWVNLTSASQSEMLYVHLWWHANNFLLLWKIPEEINNNRWCSSITKSYYIKHNVHHGNGLSWICMFNGSIYLSYCLFNLYGTLVYMESGTIADAKCNICKGCMPYVTNGWQWLFPTKFTTTICLTSRFNNAETSQRRFNILRGQHVILKT